MPHDVEIIVKYIAGIANKTSYILTADSHMWKKSLSY